MQQQKCYKKVKDKTKPPRSVKNRITICSCCKLVSDDEGNWIAFDIYVKENGIEGKINFQLKHSVCEKCLKALKQETDNFL